LEAGDEMQWLSACLACIRPWIQLPPPSKKQNKKKKLRALMKKNNLTLVEFKNKNI
jgi:hypothetical protein